MDKFTSQREFNNAYPSQIYLCHRCKNITTNPNICDFCGAQANTLFEEDIYTCSIAGIKNKIFKPVELNRKDKNE